MRKNILLTGLCSTHWGRMENGNIGNYYIVETTIRELHRVFPEVNINTTLQMTDGFCKKERISRIVPLSAYYEWSSRDMENALLDYSVATLYAQTRRIFINTPWIKEVLNNDLIIDFSGEMWGDHAEPVGRDRFLINLLKIRVAQLLGKKTILLAGSQGPFSDFSSKVLAKEVFENYSLVANRESMSQKLLEENGFKTDNVFNFACPAFLFEGLPSEKAREIIKRDKIFDPRKKRVGFILCGFNMAQGPYDKTPRHNDEFLQFAHVIEYIVEKLDCVVVLMSHQNGFDIDDGNIILKNGRDFQITEHLYQVVRARSTIDMDKVNLLKRPYDPWETAGIIGEFDMFISGRVHGLVAALSQAVPSVLINRGHGGISHRNIGFAQEAGIGNFIADPTDAHHMIEVIQNCWRERSRIRIRLENQMRLVKNKARMGFDILAEKQLL